MEVVRHIVEEFFLPEEMRDFKKDIICAEIGENVYVIGDLLVRPVNHLPFDKLSPKRNSKYIPKEEADLNKIKRAMCGREASSCEWLERMTWASQPETIPNSVKQAIRELRQPISAVIDYVGFRFQVYGSDFEMSERDTLVHGFCQSEGLFVNTDSMMNQMIPIISQSLGVCCTPKLLPGRVVPNSIQNGCMSAYVACNTLAQNLQFHRCVDEHMYVLNTTHLRPSSLCKPGTFEAHVRALRPELFEPSQLTADGRRLFVTPQSLHDVNSISVDLAQSFQDEEQTIYEVGSKTAQLNLVRRRTSMVHTVDTKKLSQAFLEENIQAASILYTKIIQETAQMLDQYVVCPLDSYSLVNLLHSKGINLHCMGLLYTSSAIPHVKQLLLCEMIARAAKELLHTVLVDVVYDAMNLTNIAVARGKSGKKEYLDHQMNSLDSMSTTIVDFFNTLFGIQGQHGTETTNALWQDILPRMIFNKFALDISNFSQNEVFHLPQLFAAVQYNTNTIFEKKDNYPFGASLTPFKREDFIDYVESCKGLEPNFMGPMSDANDCVNTLLSQEFYKDAISVYRMRLSALALANPSDHSMRHLATQNDLIYRIVLCKYGDGDYDGCIKAVGTSLRKDSLWTTNGGRFYTIGMCAHYKLGDLSSAMECFENARTAYSGALGTDHPIIASLCASVSDLYYESNRIVEAKVTLSVAMEISTHTVGKYHIVTNGYGLKLATLLTKQGYYLEALELYQRAYEVLLQYGDGFLSDVKECLCGIVICEWRASKFADALKHCSLLIMVCKGHREEIGFDELKYVLLISDIAANAKKFVEYQKYLIQAWHISRDNDSNRSCGTVMVDVTKKIFRLLFDSQTISEQNDMKLFRNDLMEKNKPFSMERVQDLKYEMFDTGPSEFFNVLKTQMEWYKTLESNIHRKFSADDLAEVEDLGHRLEVFFSLHDISVPTY